eukprot:TRINITY_DN6590_c0_g1_i1.p1 TRINITY_DN6590_c0_g1~~TRINITY_DN6590_c0_g1_i1.p1  ORF type:complete len:383 (-),score=54.85 TRINITY_DN6590_c0_g1_i1:82-1230(-)
MTISSALNRQGYVHPRKKLMALKGTTVLEFGGIGPGPFLGMMLADFGADVIVIDKPNSITLTKRGKRFVKVDLKKPSDKEAVRLLCTKADVIIDPYRPGVMEKLGFGPDVLLETNPRLVYARLTGWGQDGPYSSMAGHDLNYAALSGTLNQLGRGDAPPFPPLNLLADFSGGSLMCAWGILLALYEREKSGLGQVIDCAMVDGVLYLSTFVWDGKQNGLFSRPRGQNLLDSGAPFYDVYTTKDGKYLSVGAIEPQFYAILLEKLELRSKVKASEQHNVKKWGEIRQLFSDKIASKTQSEWCTIFDGTDACVAPVLDYEDLANHPHTVQRQMLVRNPSNSSGNLFASMTPRPAPRLSRTPAHVGDHKVVELHQLLQEFQPAKL